MRRQRRRVGLLGLLVVASLGPSGLALADVSTERSGSILVFPKVIADGDHDTIIQITNTSNSLVRAHCFYVNGTLTNPDQEQSPLNPPLCLEIDFDITLTKQQPTHWVVSTGRLVNPFDPPCSESQGGDCDGAGIDPGRIPPVVPDFKGELKCIEVDQSGAPIAGNHLKGEATIVDTSDDAGSNADVSKYNGLAILGTENNGDGTLVLGGGQCVGEGDLRGSLCGADEDCGDSGPCAVEYNACPATWILNHVADDGGNLALIDDGETNDTDTELTVVPCTENFETQDLTSVTLQFVTYNEFEQPLSASTTVTCWGNWEMDDISKIFDITNQNPPDAWGTMFLQTRIRSAAGTPFGVLMVAEEELDCEDCGVDDLQLEANAAFNVHMEGERANPDVITVPDDQLTR